MRKGVRFARFDDEYVSRIQIDLFAADYRCALSLRHQIDLTHLRVMMRLVNALRRPTDRKMKLEFQGPKSQPFACVKSVLE